MIAYFDSSALVKRLMREAGSGQVAQFASTAERIATAVVSRVEVAVALARAARIGRISDEVAIRSLRAFIPAWGLLARIAVDEAQVARAESAAWKHGLRGYDAIQLAAAMRLRDAVDAPVVMATFDPQLGAAAAAAGFDVWPARSRPDER